MSPLCSFSRAVPSRSHSFASKDMISLEIATSFTTGAVRADNDNFA